MIEKVRKTDLQISFIHKYKLNKFLLEEGTLILSMNLLIDHNLDFYELDIWI